MKKSYFKFIALGSLVVLTLTYSCKKLLNKEPTGALASGVLANKAGVDGLLIGAYHMLSGFSQVSNDNATIWSAGPDNWSYGGVGSDDAYTGSSSNDQPLFVAIENHSMDQNNTYLNEKWVAMYNGIQRANDAIREVPLVKDGSVSAAYGAEVVAEAKFLRGVFHMEVAKIFRNVPYVDENITYGAGNYDVPNPGPIWSNIEADFIAAMGSASSSFVLPTTQPQVGRVNYYGAEAMLAEAYMFDHKYASALPLLTDLLTNGKTSSGAKYAFEPFNNNFNSAFNNGTESVFAVQMTVNDGSNGSNGNPGLTLDNPNVLGNCCGFYQPSISLADAFQVDANGLPMFQPSVKFPGIGSFLYNDNQLPTDHGYALDPSGAYRASVVKDGVTTFSGPAFTPPTNALDPRIDWTLGRAGLPYLDWGICGGEQWSRGNLCPYSPIKNIFWLNAHHAGSDNVLGWDGTADNANNYNYVRLSDVYLWAAECEVEVGSLTNAQADVNAVRSRMADHHEYWVHTYINNANPSQGNNTGDANLAANYKIGLYGAAAGTSFASMGQAQAREAVHMEEQLETGMEGKRFFDLQRWDPIFGGPESAGFMAGVENFHIKATLIGRFSNTYVGGVLQHPADDLNPNGVLSTFTAGRNELYPIPLPQINLEAGKLKQNPGYN